ncbi:hypothetical protein BDAP_002425 [Binucleata daphniae]
MILKNIAPKHIQLIALSVFAVIFILQIFIAAKIYILVALAALVFFVRRRDRKLACAIAILLLYVVKYFISVKKTGWNPIRFFGYTSKNQITRSTNSKIEKKISKTKNKRKHNDEKIKEDKYGTISIFAGLRVYDCFSDGSNITYCLYTQKSYYEKNILNNLKQNRNKKFNEQIRKFMDFLTEDMSKHEIRTTLKAKVLEDIDDGIRPVDLMLYLKNNSYNAKYVVINNDSIVARKYGKSYKKVIAQKDKNNDAKLKMTEQDINDMLIISQCIKHPSKYDTYPSIAIIYERQ